MRYLRRLMLMFVAGLCVLTVNVQPAGATVVVPDSFEPPDWKADYGVFHRQQPAGGTPQANPASEFSSFRDANIFGDGVTIGVIGESGDSSHPTNTALQSLINAIAPQATVRFESGFDQGQITSNDRPTRDNISAAIQAHRNNGVDVIVDGASYLTEPFFQTNSFSSDVGQAVRDARDNGIAYFAAAGDLNQNVYQSQWHDPVGTGVSGVSGFTHKFDNGGSDQTLSLKVQPGETASFALQWQSKNGDFPNLNLAMVDDSGLALSGRVQRPQSDVDQDGNNDDEPWEILTWTNDTRSQADIELAVIDDPEPNARNVSAAALETAFKLLWVQADLDDTAEVGTFDAPTIHGHGMEAILIGSMDAQNARNVFNGGSASVDETSSHLDVDEHGELPFFIAPDNWETDEGEALDGTVVSAAWTGALTALMLDQADDMGVMLTDAQIEQLLRDAAIDIESNGFDAGSGFGLIDPDEAFNAVEAIPEPGSGALLLAGVGLALTRRRR